MTTSYAVTTEALTELKKCLVDAISAANSADDKDFLHALIVPIDAELQAIFAQDWAERTDAYEPLTNDIAEATKRLEAVADDIKRIVKRIDQAAQILTAIAKVVKIMAPFVI